MRQKKKLVIRVRPRVSPTSSAHAELLELRTLHSAPPLIDPAITFGGVIDPSTGQVIYPDAEPADSNGVPSPVGSSATTYPLSSLPALDSLPGATDKIYLDFVGAAAMMWGGTHVPATAAYDVDGDPTTFSAQELQNITQIWSQVAEAYSPFNIDVTTVDPDPVNHTNYPHDQDARLIIGGSNSWTGSNVGGISYVRGFSIGSLPNVSFIFPSALSDNNTYIADGTIHEAGHQFGLYHQSTYSGTTLTSEYNYGNSLVGPIMGCAYYSTRALWFDGQNDQSSTTIQDDMSVISSSFNGFGYRTEPSNISISTASALTLSGGAVSASGVIEHTTDSDVYSFNTAAGAISLNVNVAQYGAMLHAQEVLENGSGQVIASADNANTLGQTISATVSAGTYYLFVESFGQYGDVGQYTVSGTVATVNPTPTFAISGSSTVNEQSTYTLSLSGTDPGNTISNWAVNWGDGDTQTVTGNPSSVTHTYALGPNNYTISASATDNNGSYNAGNTVAVSVAHVTPTVTLSGASSVNEEALYTLGLSALDPGHTIASWLVDWGDGSTTNISGNPSSITHTYSVGPNSYTITALMTDDVNAYAAGNSLVVAVAHLSPTLTISGASSVNENSTYTLGLSASDPNHTISSWLITWGDGSTSNVAGNLSSTSHTYADGPNSYTISATATDDVSTYAAGNTVAVAVIHVPPVLTLSGASSVNENSTYTLGLSAGDPNHTISSWLVSWGDGSTSNVAGNLSSTSHTYAEGPTNYTISATATDDVSTYAAGNTIAVSVAHVVPTLTLSGASSVNEGSTYTLGLSSSDPSHTISSWLVTWGDGSTSNVAGNLSSTSHTYAAGPHTYTISATATDDVSTYAAGNTIAISVGHVPPTLALSGSSSIIEGSTYILGFSSSDPSHTISNWVVTWGDGSTSNVAGNLSSASHTYAEGPNTYTISATATDDVSTYAAGNTIAVSVAHVPPTLTLSGSSSVNENEVYTLGLSASDPNHPISGWFITWGDGSTSSVAGNLPNTSHIYTEGPNNYTISATATDDVNTYAAGNTIAISVAHVAPTLILSGSSSVNEGSAYSLGLSASDPNHSISSWLVAWGDGSTTNVVGGASSVNHTYAAGPHSYTITATATDDVSTYPAGNTVTVSVSHVAPTLTLSGAASVNEGSPYVLGLSASDPNHSISSWAITWGDGSTSNVAGNLLSASHTYAAGPHNYTITATADDDVSTYAAGNSVAVSVMHVSPLLVLSGASTSNERALYTLGLSSSDPSHTISSWLVTWGDGSVSNVAGNPSSINHTFSTGPNSYTITATATDDVGTYAAGNTLTVAVGHVPPSLTLSGALSVNEGSLYTLSLSSSDPNHTISNWLVTWGDGSTSNVTGNPSSVSHTYSEGPQTFTITANATDDVGTYAASNSINVAVGHDAPTLTLSGDSIASEGSPYTLGLLSNDPGHTIFGWLIAWGDGTTSNVIGNPSSVSHTFAVGPNDYTISATATDDVSNYAAGNSIAVSVLHVAPTLTLSGPSVVDEGSVYTLGLSSIDPNHTISNWLIAWGDGSTSNVIGDPSSVMHTYAAGPHTYTISAKATDDVDTYLAGNVVSVMVAHVLPSVVISGASSIDSESSYKLNLSATDPGHAVLNWFIAWGDGSTTDVSDNPSSVSHIYAGGGQTYTITASATDDVGTYPAKTDIAIEVNAPKIPSVLTLSGANAAMSSSGATFSLTLVNPAGIDLSTAEETAVDVVGPRNFLKPATLMSETAVSATSVTLEFGISAPDAAWSWNDNGPYTFTATPAAALVPTGAAPPQATAAFAVDQLAIDGAGNTLKKARNLGRSASGFNQNFTDTVGPFDPLDYYQLQLTRTQGLSCNVSDLIDGITVQFLNRAGHVLSTQSANAGGNIAMNSLLPAGIYYIKVASTGTNGTAYNMNLSTVIPPVDRAGNTLAQARKLNTITPKSNITVSDTVNPFDTQDFYSLTLGKNSSMALNLTGLFSDVSVQMFNSKGAQITTLQPNLQGVVSYSPPWTTGRYYLEVTSIANASATYTLNVLGIAVSAPLIRSALRI